ncbi:MAG: anaerobic ribonucleoside-triphosphate reductase activating protein [Alistipes sp.]|nr:anaerobic ribonucleoside-triphosphate reductase activating protein [Alistipes sp.]
MMLLASYDIVFQEVPGEITLALNLSACPNNCPGCHSPHLREVVGEQLDDALLEGLLARYGGAVTCVGFMGGDGQPAEVNRLAAKIHATTNLKTAWYSGREELSPAIRLENLDYLKLGPYDPACGGLDNPATNQHFYRVEGGELIDATALFRKKPLT